MTSLPVPNFSCDLFRRHFMRCASLLFASWASRSSSAAAETSTLYILIMARVHSVIGYILYAQQGWEESTHGRRALKDL